MMNQMFGWMVLALLTFPNVIPTTGEAAISDTLPPTVMIVCLIRNKAHVLPHFFALLEQLDYPKSRISIYIRSDHNEDATSQIVNIWVKKWRLLKEVHPASEDVYHSLDVVVADEGGPQRQADQVNGPLHWSHDRYRHVMHLREDGLNAARKAWADWVWQLDVDVFLTNPTILTNLLSQSTDVTIIAPVLNSLSLYSNFWGGMSDKFYYERTEDYEQILRRKIKDCHSVPMVNSCVLVNLRRKESKKLTYIPEKLTTYNGPFDDIITFAVSASSNDIDMLACNDKQYGFLMLPMDESGTLDDDKVNFSNLKLEIIAYASPLPTTDELEVFTDVSPVNETKLGVDNVYMINLERRPDRRSRTEAMFSELGIVHELVRAVDGKRDIDENYLRTNQIKMMPDFIEPYHGRALTHGEIGCFMSHFNVWRDVLAKNYEKVIVLEDDVRFEPFFLDKIRRLHQEVERLQLDWELIFLGRKILSNLHEPWVEGSELLVHVNYTYWTLGYMLNRRGAMKLVEENPLPKMVPVDEYLPIMYDAHPNATWKSHYTGRNLKAFSVHPLFLFPTYYTGEEGYISDTEDSAVIAMECDKSKTCSHYHKDEL